MISIHPTDTEWVDIINNDWDLSWALQFPEAITAGGKTLKTWPSIAVDWRKVSDDRFYYEWRPTDKYIEERLNDVKKDSEGNPIHLEFISGLKLRSEISAGDSDIELEITLTNETDETIRDVRSEGGCFQARNDDFKDNDEVGRSFLFTDDKLIRMTDVPRTNPIRCKYLTDRAGYDGQYTRRYEWFWGRSEYPITSPAVVGAVSGDGTRTVALGYERSISAQQNADSHHCLHSCPHFGDIEPGRAVTRKGYMLFGDSPDAVARELYKKISI